MSVRARTSAAAIAAPFAVLACGLAASAPAAAACPNAQARVGPSALLPDCRAYEQVSPAGKAGLDAATLQPLQPAQSSECAPGAACAVAYMSAGAAFAGAQANEPANAYVATRGAEGWLTTALGPPTPQAPANSHPQVTYAFSADLSQTVLRVPLQQLTATAPAGVYNLFLRQADGGYSLVTAATPAEPPQAGCGHCFEGQDVPAFAGASSDFGHVIFESSASLVAPAPVGGVESLYEATGEHVRLVGVLPDGTVPPQGSTAGAGIEAAGSERAGELAHAISADGSRVLFQAASDGGPAYAGGPSQPAQAGLTELYDRIGATTTVEVSAPAPGAQPSGCETEQGVCDAEPARFWAASADGSLVYFTSKAALTKDSNVGPEERSEEELEEEEETEERIENPGSDLYRYDLATGTLSDLTIDHREEDPDGATVLGVVGTSEDGSYVYFVAEGALAAGATSGRPNLYVWHQTGTDTGTTSFVATLSPPTPAEEERIERTQAGPSVVYRSDVGDWTARPTESQAYVTPDGRHLAFMSVMPLTGYDNEDRQTGEADHEVFEYGAEDGALACASCDPGGERPYGSAFIGARLYERASTPFHQPRSLSDDGARLFFGSPDPLVPGVAGGSARVFEYEQGAAHLISGGDGGAVFLDASARGDDVFLATRERLAPSDEDQLVDVYDARVGGGLPIAAAPAPCQGGGCREPLVLAPSLPSPASASFLGAGNLVAAPPRKLTRRQKLARALARCRRLKRAKRRRRCRAAARRRYGPRKARGGRRHGRRTSHRRNASRRRGHGR